MTMAQRDRLRVLVWHSHGSYTGAFVQGRHEYLLPVLPEGGKWGMGRAGRACAAPRHGIVNLLDDAPSLPA